MTPSSTRAAIGRLRDVCDPWSLAIVALSVVIVAPVTTLWLYLGGLGWIKALLVESAGPTVPVQVVALHPLEHLLTEIAIGLGLAIFVGVDSAIAWRWLRRRGFVARAPRSIAVVAGAIAVWLGLAVAGGAIAVQTVAVPVLDLLATVVGLAGAGSAGTPVVRVSTLALIIGSVAVVGGVATQAGVIGSIEALDRLRHRRPGALRAR